MISSQGLGFLPSFKLGELSKFKLNITENEDAAFFLPINFNYPLNSIHGQFEHLRTPG